MQRVLWIVTALTLVVPGIPAGAPAAAEEGFAYGGVIEGFYGTPWAHDVRIESFEWMATRGLDTYVYAPKDDHFQRANWRVPYPPAKLAKLRDAASAAGAAGVRWVPNISPGPPLLPSAGEPGIPISAPACFSCTDDREAVVAKLAPFVDAGVNTVMVSLDDVVPWSTHPEDILTYGFGLAAAGRMHRDFLNAVHAGLAARADRPVTMFTVLYEYAGTTDSSYLGAVRGDGGLDTAIEVAWTGPGVTAPMITARQAGAYAGNVGRERILLWDNFPVNDFTPLDVTKPPTRVFLGPYRGRSADLSERVSGILANPMSQARASRIALATMADYLGDPDTYDADRAWRAAIVDTAGDDPAAADALSALAENSRSSALEAEDARTFRRVTRAVVASGGAEADAAARARTEIAREMRARDVLVARAPALAAELDPWLRRLGDNAAVAELALDTIVERPRSLHARVATAGRLVRAWSRSVGDRHVTHGDRFGFYLDGIRTGRNELDRFVADALAMTL